MGVHLRSAHVRPTLEVIVTETPAHLRRKEDKRTGLALIALDGSICTATAWSREGFRARSALKARRPKLTARTSRGRIAAAKPRRRNAVRSAPGAWGGDAAMQTGHAARRFSFYAGLALVTAATLMIQIIETRIISVTSWYHLAFFVISIAMFGLTAGAVWVYLRRPFYRPDQLSYHLAVASLAFALALVGALLVQLTNVTSLPASVMSVVVWAEFAIALSLPFFFSGIVVSLALTRSPYPVGIVYGADLIGAAVGCIGVLALLNVVTGPSAVLWVAVMIAAGGLLFAHSRI